MPNTNRKRTSSKNAEIGRVPSLYSISANLSPSKAARNLRKSQTFRAGDGAYENARNTVAETIMMGQLDKWNSSGDVRNERRMYSPDHSMAELERPVAFVQPMITRTPSGVESRRNPELRLPPSAAAAGEFKNDYRSGSPNSEYAAYNGQPASSATSLPVVDKSEIVLEEFDNSLFILCVVCIFINPILGPIAAFAAWRAKKAFFAASWKAFRKWTIAAHALSSIGLGLSAIGFGMVGIKLYHMYSGTQCFYKCSFLTNNEFNWQGFWDDLNKQRGGSGGGL